MKKKIANHELMIEIFENRFDLYAFMKAREIKNEQIVSIQVTIIQHQTAWLRCIKEYNLIYWKYN